jgi:hypothetical protein
LLHGEPLGRIANPTTKIARSLAREARMALRWNGVLIDNPGVLRRPSGWQRLNLELEHTIGGWTTLCVSLALIAGRLTAPVLGY